MGTEGSEKARRSEMLVCCYDIPLSFTLGELPFLASLGDENMMKILSCFLAVPFLSQSSQRSPPVPLQFHATTFHKKNMKLRIPILEE